MNMSEKSIHQLSTHLLAISSTSSTSKHPNEDTRNTDVEILMTKCSLSIQHMLHCNHYPNYEVTSFSLMYFLFSYVTCCFSTISQYVQSSSPVLKMEKQRKGKINIVMAVL